MVVRIQSAGLEEFIKLTEEYEKELPEIKMKMMRIRLRAKLREEKLRPVSHKYHVREIVRYQTKVA